MDYSIHHNFDRKLNALYVDYYYCESTIKLKRVKIVQRTVLKCIKKKKKRKTFSQSPMKYLVRFFIFIRIKEWRFFSHVIVEHKALNINNPVMPRGGSLADY